MTREQEIKEMAKIKSSHITSDKDMQVAFADALRSGAEWADRTMIDKACEWLHTALYLDHEHSIEHRYATLEELLNDFRKAMKGE